jgi:hypothetical protein
MLGEDLAGSRHARPSGASRTASPLTGHDHCTLCVRWVRATEHPEPKRRVVEISEIA